MSVKIINELQREIIKENNIIYASGNSKNIRKKSINYCD